MASDRKQRIAILINSVEAGQRMGAYLLREASLLKKAKDYFNEDLPADKKSTFDGADNPEMVAVNLLLQGVAKAQAHGGPNAYSLDDADYLWEITQEFMKEMGKAVAQNVGGPSKPKEKPNPKAAAASIRGTDVDEEDDDDDANEIKAISPRKGKERVA